MRRKSMCCAKGLSPTKSRTHDNSVAFVQTPWLQDSSKIKNDFQLGLTGSEWNAQQEVRRSKTTKRIINLIVLWMATRGSMRMSTSRRRWSLRRLHSSPVLHSLVDMARQPKQKLQPVLKLLSSLRIVAVYIVVELRYTTVKPWKPI